MNRIGIIGGGIAGATAAVELAAARNQVYIIEKTAQLGGNLKDFGCKAADICTKDNLCLVDDIISEARDKENIKIYYRTGVNDFRSDRGNYSLGIERNGNFQTITELDNIILATGFTKWSELETGTPEIFLDKRVIWASELEEFIKKRKDHLQVEDPLELGFIPDSAVFIQCNGSRSIQEKARYCSRVCCAYSYRMARALKYFFPDIEVTMFFMDLQEGGFLQDITFSDLEKTGINYLNCKPIRINAGKEKLSIIYEDQTQAKMRKLETELLVLSEGIHARKVNEKWSRLFNFQLDEYGFLYPIEEEEKRGIYLAGTIKGPKDIAGTISDSKNVAYRIINNYNLAIDGGENDV